MNGVGPEACVGAAIAFAAAPDTALGALARVGVVDPDQSAVTVDAKRAGQADRDAGGDAVIIKIEGLGGHAARPHLCDNAITRFGSAPP